jgi:hypothetical protein
MEKWKLPIEDNQQFSIIMFEYLGFTNFTDILNNSQFNDFIEGLFCFSNYT